MALETINEPGANASRTYPRDNAKIVPASSGIIVALVGPDGVGKSSQTARLTSIFQEQHKCTAIYLGSGDGGWKWRQRSQRYYRKWRRILAPGNSPATAKAPGRTISTNHSTTAALTGLVLALERYVTLRRAKRLASAGFIVISDRWPQNVQPGLFDGPLLNRPNPSSIVRLLSWMERGLYRRMQSYRPDLTIHLLSDFETSSSRKPGDRNQTDFDLRLSIMQELRSVDPTIRTVDARNGFEEVTKELSDLISHMMSERAGASVDGLEDAS